MPFDNIALRHLELPMQPLNPEKADEDLQALLGNVYHGMSTAETITVHLLAEADKAVDEQIIAYLQTHDPAAVSAAELEREEKVSAETRLKETDLNALREEVGKTDPNVLLLRVIDLLEDLLKTR